MIGCSDEPEPVVENPKSAEEEPKTRPVEPKTAEKPKVSPGKPKRVAVAPKAAQKPTATPREPRAVVNRATSEPRAIQKPNPALLEAVTSQRECSQRLGLPLRIANSIGMKLTLIPAGEFMMGSSDSDDDVPPWEKPQHKVRITKPYYVGVYEVTQGEYETVMGENPSYFEGAGNPVEQVSWYDTVEFCKKLSAMEGKTYRLPTEAEWEYACHAGTATRYSFGDDAGSVERYANCDSNKTYAVGMKRPNAWGLYDTHGNVWECCKDRWAEDYYAISPTEDPPGPETGPLRVIRGGGWKDPARDCRAATRSGFVSAGRLQHMGFRVAANPSDFQDIELPRPNAERIRQPLGGR